MLTKELITNITNERGLTRQQTEDLLAATVGSITDSLREGRSVQLQGLGTIEIKRTAERAVVNPTTKERTIAKARTTVGLRPATALKEELKKLNIQK